MPAAERVSFRFRTRSLYARLIEAMSMGDALEALGLPVGSSPTPQEVSKAYKDKAFKNHPDRGGDPTKMVEINVAKDILEGKERPTGGGGGYSAPEPSGYTAPQREKPEPRRVSFDEAKSKAGVPQADWKFKTQTAFGGHGDTSVSGFVLCGKLGDKLVFVAVESYRSQNAFTGEDVDEWWMKGATGQGSFRDVAPKLIRQLFSSFPHLSKKFNAKVEILPDGAVLNERMLFSRNRAVSFKDAMAMMGEIDQNDPWAQRKVTVQIITHSRKEMTDRDYDIELVVNGKGYTLRKDNADKMQSGSAKIMQAIFGDYYYDESKKLLTRSKNGPAAMQWMIDNLRGEPNDLIAALTAAIEQASKPAGGRRRRR